MTVGNGRVNVILPNDVELVYERLKTTHREI